MPLRLQQRVYFHQGASPVRKSVSVLEGVRGAGGEGGEGASA
jgi:hypothetical protein